jgi:hypothetical protein
VPEIQNIIPCLRPSGLKLGLQFSDNVLDVSERTHGVEDDLVPRKPVAIQTVDIFVSWEGDSSPNAPLSTASSNSCPYAVSKGN